MDLPKLGLINSISTLLEDKTFPTLLAIFSVVLSRLVDCAGRLSSSAFLAVAEKAGSFSSLSTLLITLATFYRNKYNIYVNIGSNITMYVYVYVVYSYVSWHIRKYVWSMKNI